MTKQVILLVLIVVLFSVQVTESVLYTWNGVCPVWSPHSPSTCWEPHGAPSHADTIQIAENKNLTLYCPNTFTGSSNSFYSAIYSYGPTCVFQVGSVIATQGSTFQVSSYLAATINLPSYIEEGANMILSGSLAAIDGIGNLHIAGNLSVNGGNVQGNGSLMVEKSGTVYFNAFPSVALDCYLLRTKVIINGSLAFNNPTMIGFWWQPHSTPYEIIVLGSLYFNTFYVFTDPTGVNFKVEEGGKIYSDSLLDITDIRYQSLVNYGTVEYAFPVVELDNYGSLSDIYSCSSALNYGNIGELSCGEVLNYGTLSGVSAFNITNYGDITSCSSSEIYNYGNIYRASCEHFYNYANATVYSYVPYIINEGILGLQSRSEQIINLGLVKTMEAYDYVQTSVDILENFEIIYVIEDTSIYQLQDYNGIIYTDVANFEFQPLYWFWIKGYPQSVYSWVPAYGPGWKNTPILKGPKEYPIEFPILFNSTSLSGSGSFQLNVPGMIVQNLFIDTSVNIEIWSANYTAPLSEQYSFNVAGNITISADGSLSAIANFFTAEEPFYIHVFGEVEAHLIFTNLSIVVHPKGSFQVSDYLHVITTNADLIGGGGGAMYNNTIEVFGSLIIVGRMKSDVNIILHHGGVLTLQANSELNLDDAAVIESCGGQVVNNGGTLNGNVVACSTSSSTSVHHNGSGLVSELYSPFVNAVEFVRSRKENIIQRLSKYQIEYHHSS